ncbi:MAG: helix-turn-helix transcriptional regulator [Berryella intestinalis]|uniref:helix-turn-helix domain-containing protein n=1 Tax=Berryella intestinalis TaxID=1531429 RepID=UPI002A4F0AFB|nr:helix-turn-helix transcriptional regulator [Berryella intestinalis]MDD7368543.1 helix-turn-helix transcriptional regulator [Berryella intestinalis]MDY3129108.1 helix-turn-helix transcriptional regulator [Berryella intestinalis]
MTGISRPNGTTAFNAGWAPRLPALGLGLLFASFLSVIERSTAPTSLATPGGLPGLALAPAVGDAHALFVSSSMAGAVLAGIIVALYLHRRSSCSDDRALTGCVLPAAQAAFMAFGFAGALSIQLTGGGMVTSALCGFLFGAGGLVGAVGWSTLVARSFPGSYALHGSSAIAVAGVLTAVSSLFGGIGMVMYAVLLAAVQFALIAADKGLSKREGEAFRYLARGHTQAYIAEQLFISENTVRTHVRRIHAKLGVSSRSELLELVDLPDQTDD